MKYYLLLVLLIAAGCAPQKQQTKLKVSFGATISNSQFPGGLVIYGKSNNGFRLNKVIPPGDEVTIDIPNGKWNFSVVGWAGLGLMQGGTFCDSQVGVDLTGSPEQLTFNATAAGCTNSIFGGNSDGTNFSAVRVISCLSAKEKVQQVGIQNIPDNLVCDGNDLLSGRYKSFRLVIPEFVGNQAQSFVGGSLVSSCEDGAGSNSILTGLNVPAGSPLNPGAYVIQAFDNTTCSGIPNDFFFPEGLNSVAGEDFEGFGKWHNSSFQTDIIISNDACTPDMLAAQDAEANPVLASFPLVIDNDTNEGDITAGNPNIYLICREADLERMANYDTDANHGTKDGIYHLGQDIDLGGTNTTTLGDFQGEFKGNGFTISNGNNPIFKTIYSHPNYDVRISELSLTNFAITSALTTHVGVLAANLITIDTHNQIEIDRIDVIDSSIINSSATNAGGLIGSITHNNTSEHTFIRKNTIQVDITEGGTDNKIGGIIGSATANPNSSIAFELNFVGTDPDNTNISRIDAVQLTNIIGSNTAGTPPVMSAIGGIVGYGSYVEIRDYNFVLADINASENSGGIAGYVQNQFSIEHSFASTYYIPDEDDIVANTTNGCDSSSSPNICQNVGGLIGKVYDSTQLGIKGTVSALKIEPHTEQVDNVGGIIGTFSAGVASNNVIEDIRSYVDISDSAGDFYGGVYGSFSPTGDSGFTDINRAYVHGSMTFNPNLAVTSDKWAGFAGSANGLKVESSMVDIIIEADSSLAGGMGDASGTSTMRDVYIKADITSQDTTNINVGGAYGYIQSSNSHNFFQSKVDATLRFPAMASLSPSADAIGLLFGFLNEAQGTAVNEILEESLVVGTIYYDDPETDYGLNTDSHFLCGKFSSADGNCGALEVGGSDNFLGHSAGICSTINASVQTTEANTGIDFFSYDNDLDCLPTTIFEWKRIASVDDNNDGQIDFYSAGSKLEPIEIETVAQWNAIGENPAMMKKTIEITNDLNFFGENFNPLGFDASDNTFSAFQGNLLSAGNRIYNITINDTDKYGVIQEIDNATIGDRDEPFIIEGVDFDCDNNYCGLIGLARNYNDVFLDATDITITESFVSGNYIGGFVGNIASNANVNIEHSRFEGEIDASGGTGSYVGGLVGVMASGTNDLTVKESAVVINGIESNDGLGGFVGSLDVSTKTVDIIDSYVFFTNGAAVSTTTGNNIGGVFGYSNSGSSSVNVENIFIDFSSAALHVNFHPISPTTNSESITLTNVELIQPGTAISAALNPGPTLVGATNNQGAQVDALSNINNNDAFVIDGNRLLINWEVNGFED